jgi:DNA repair protein RadA/Sms
MLHCSHCDAQYLRWQGRCSECGKWGTLPKEGESGNGKTKKGGAKAAPLVDLSQAKAQSITRQSTGLEEFDRVLGGGLVPGSVTLLSGEPGIGKSTLVAQLAGSFKQQEKSCYYASGEESEHQVALRLKRLGIAPDGIHFSNSVVVESVIAAAEKLSPALVIIDSIQTMTSKDIDSFAGTPTAVRAATALLIHFAKTTGTPVLIIGQVTKEGSIAGPKTLEHLVDTVLTMEGDADGLFRILRAGKHRFGSTDEAGIFHMTQKGLEGVDNPSQLLLSQRSNTPGSVITCVMEGTRPLLIEIQALVEKSYYPNPIRRTSGFDNGRLQMLIAIINKHTSFSLAGYDVYINVVGGMKVKDPSTDLAVCGAILSSMREKAFSKETLLLGELGLGGELRSVPFLEKRLKEAKRLGYTDPRSPKNTKHISEI